MTKPGPLCPFKQPAADGALDGSLQAQGTMLQAQQKAHAVRVP
jgi:hypothetical protein